jgi:hypothetical protein
MFEKNPSKRQSSKYIVAKIEVITLFFYFKNIEKDKF